MSTPFAFDLVENSMRIMVDGEISEWPSPKETPELVIRLWHTLVMGPTLPFIPPSPFHHEPFHETIPQSPFKRHLLIGICYLCIVYYCRGGACSAQSNGDRTEQTLTLPHNQSQYQSS